MQRSFHGDIMLKESSLENRLFTKTDIRRLLIPLISEQVLAYLVGLMDSIMVSSAGEAAVSAVSLIDSISILMINIFASLSAGGSVVAGQYLGMKNEGKSRMSAEQLMVILAALSTVISALLLLLRVQLIELLFGSADATVKSNCNTYYHIVMYSIPFIALYNGGAALFRVTGDSRTPMRISLLMNAINIAGNAVLIYIFKLGVAGVAIPTLVSRAVAMLIILIKAMKPDFSLNLRSIKSYRYNSAVSRNIFSIGIPNSIEGGMFQFGKIMLLSLVSTLSTASITANAVGNTVGALHCVIGMAANQALITVVSRCVGARDYSQARFFTRYFIKLTYIIQGLVCVLMILLIPLICRIYGLSSETGILASRIMLLHAATTILLWPPAFMLSTSMRAAGDSAFAMWIAIVSMWICRVGLSYVLILVFKCSVVSIWYAWIVDWLFRMAFCIPRYLGHRWETKAIKQ